MNAAKFALIFLLILIAGCTNYSVSPEAGTEMVRARKEIDDDGYEKACANLKEFSYYSPEVFNLIGECQEKGQGHDMNQAVEFYRRAAICGNRQAKENLQRLGFEVPKEKYKEGVKFYSMDQAYIEQCGYQRGMTKFGYAVTGVIAVPATAAAIVVAPAALAAGVILSPFILISRASES